MQTYADAISFLYGRLNYERTSMPYGPKELKLDRMRALLAGLGNPQDALRIIHVAGTKGKGSTSVMIAAMLAAAGYRTGLFTSPHLYRLEERLVVDGRPAASDELVELLRILLPRVRRMDRADRGGPDRLTFFEITTAMGLVHFARRATDAVVLEVGLGGRLDSTNICAPAVGVITTISRDHTRQLGTRLESIAAEKAGIVKPGVPVVCGVTAEAARQVIAAVCADRSARLRQAGSDFRATYHPPEPRPGRPEPGRVDVETWRRRWASLPLSLPGAHQAANAAVAVATLETLIEDGWAIDPESAGAGLAQVRWPARVEVIAERPTVIVDGAHNYASVGALIETLTGLFRARRRVLVFGTTRDKDVRGMLSCLIPQFEQIILTQYENNPRAVAPEELALVATSLADVPVTIQPNPAAAWQWARRSAGRDDLVCATGSFFLAAEFRQAVLGTTSLSPLFATGDS